MLPGAVPGPGAAGRVRWRPPVAERRGDLGVLGAGCGVAVACVGVRARLAVAAAAVRCGRVGPEVAGWQQPVASRAVFLAGRDPVEHPAAAQCRGCLYRGCHPAFTRPCASGHGVIVALGAGGPADDAADDADPGSAGQADEVADADGPAAAGTLAVPACFLHPRAQVPAGLVEAHRPGHGHSFMIPLPDQAASAREPHRSPR
jgi:hypothetical protein